MARRSDGTAMKPFWSAGRSSTDGLATPLVIQITPGVPFAWVAAIVAFTRSGPTFQPSLTPQFRITMSQGVRRPTY